MGVSILVILVIIGLWVLIAVINSKKRTEELERLIYQYDKTASQESGDALINFMNNHNISTSKQQKVRSAMYHRLADAGDVFALMMVYDIHHDNKQLAYEYLHRAAQLGSVAAFYELGMQYSQHGNSSEYYVGFGYDPALAFSWFSKAAQHGHEDAIRYVATAYHNGEGVKEDKEKAFAYAKSFSDRGYPQLSFFLVLYFYNSPISSHYQPQAAVTLLERIMYRGHSDSFKEAARELGFIHGGAYLYNSPPDAFSDRRKAAYCFFLVAALNNFDEFYINLFKKTGYMATQFEINTWKNDAENLRYNPH